MPDLYNETNITEVLEDLNRRLSSLEMRLSRIETYSPSQIDNKMAVFLTIPDSMRKSLFAVSNLKSCTADDVSVVTGRHRSIENKYLNELYRGGWLERERKGKKIYYSMRRRDEAAKDNQWSVLEEVESKLDQLLG